METPPLPDRTDLGGEPMRRLQAALASLSVGLFRRIWLPLKMLLLVGGGGSLLSVGAVFLVAGTGEAKLTAAAYALMLAAIIVFPLAYVALGVNYGLAQAAYQLYRACREPVAELVASRLDAARAQPAGSGAARGALDAASAAYDWGNSALQKLPGALRRVGRVVLRWLAGAKLAALLSKTESAGASGKIEVVAAVIDEVVEEHVLGTPRALIKLVAALNAVALGGLWYLGH